MLVKVSPIMVSFYLYVSFILEEKPLHSPTYAESKTNVLNKCDLNACEPGFRLMFVCLYWSGLYFPLTSKTVNKKIQVVPAEPSSSKW